VIKFINGFQVKVENMIIKPDSLVLVTGATGFIGLRVIERLIDYGFHNLRCFVRPSSNMIGLHEVVGRLSRQSKIEVVTGNLQSMEDCEKAAKDVVVIYHLAIGAAGKSFPSAFLNTVIPTRNLLEACIQSQSLKRFVNISSFAVYSNRNKPQSGLLDESCPIDRHPELRGDAYAFAKLKQDELVIDYAKKNGIRYVILRPGAVYGPENYKITGRVGIDTFGIFLHLGGSNKVPFTYVDNCAEAIVLAGLVRDIDGEVFNIVDDDLPSSRRFLNLYKKHVKRFKSIYIPHALSYLLCYLWEKYCAVSNGQLPALFSRNQWHAYWKKTRYSNEKLKGRLGWKMRVSTEEGLKRYYESCRERVKHA
jgi:nucleoside-diphosphate-sugar epimerase